MADKTFSFSQAELEGIASRVIELAKAEGASAAEADVSEAWARP